MTTVTVTQMCESGPFIRCGTVMQWRMSSWAKWCCPGRRRTPPTHRSFSWGKEDGTQLTRCPETSPWRSSQPLSWPPYDPYGETDWGASSSNRCSVFLFASLGEKKRNLWWTECQLLFLNPKLKDYIFIPPAMFHTELLHTTSKMQKKNLKVVKVKVTRITWVKVMYLIANVFLVNVNKST